MSFNRIMCIDYGDARVGIAVSDLLGITAQGVETIKNKNKKSLFERLLELIKYYDPKTIVIGMPKNMDGTVGFRGEATLKFADELKKIYPGKIEFFDERLSTVSAIHTLNETNTRGEKRKNVIDTVAAAIILQTYMDMFKNKNA